MKFLLHPPPPLCDANMCTEICCDSSTLCGFVSAKRGDIELPESLPLGNGDNAWSQYRDQCLTTLLKLLNYTPISRKQEMSYSDLNMGLEEFDLLTTKRNELVKALFS